VQAALKAGKSPDDIAAAWQVPDKYKGYSFDKTKAADTNRLKANVGAIATELKK
jgi:hypothetical protein